MGGIPLLPELNLPEGCIGWLNHKAHESFPADEMSKIGFEKYVKNAPLKGLEESKYTKEI